MPEVDLDLGPLVDPEGGSALVGAEAEQRVRRDDVATAGTPPRDALELAQLFERIDPHVRVGADADADPALAEPLDRSEAVAEVRLGGRGETNTGAGVGDQVELGAFGVGG